MIIAEPVFVERLRDVLLPHSRDNIAAVTGPGMSGAIAAVYASHLLGVPFFPYGHTAPERKGKLLLVDTARQSGRTLRKAERRYPGAVVAVAFEEPPRVRFWYETRMDREAA